MTTAKAACAAVAALTALLVGGGGTANAAAAQTLQKPVGVPHATGGPSQAASGARACPSGWLCLYEHANFQGRMLKFRDDYWQQLSSYGFNDKTSSWKNRLNRNACLSKHWPAAGAPKLRLEAGACSARMGDWNDEASGVKAGRC
ncbi:MAG TPA: peptidase inhibitor family I36 protein [Pseudonocardiaceae bacterium]|jgi:hypothetical protein|nr:peptidase inhibitor family I36 protein [Pseudonocardiaceae bacterium]